VVSEVPRGGKGGRVGGEGGAGLEGGEGRLPEEDGRI
jgi:hypothetical protein